MNIRCVVTGQTGQGKSVFVHDAPIEPITLSLLPGFEFHRLWGSESVPNLPSDGTAPPHSRYFPPQGGFRFGFFTIPPEAGVAAEPAQLALSLAELQQKLPGMAEVLEMDVQQALEIFENIPKIKHKLATLHDVGLGRR